MKQLQKDKFIFFDLDGPILDVSSKYYRLYSELVEKYGGKPLSKNDYWNHKRNKIKEKDILSMSNVSTDNDIDNIRKSIIETKKYLLYDKLSPYILKILSIIKSNYCLILVTLRHNRDTLLWELKHFGLDDKFDLILSTEATGLECEHYINKIHLIQKNIDPNGLSGWFVGDTETDIRTGTLLQLNTIAVSYGIRDKQFLEPLSPTLLFDSPEQLRDFWVSS